MYEKDQKNLISFYERAGNAFEQKFGVSTGATFIMMPGSGRCFMTDANGKGISAQGTLIGCVEPMRRGYVWRWGWEVKGFESPVVDRRLVSEELSSHGCGQYGIAKGLYKLEGANDELTIRGAAMRSHNFEYVTEFSGPTDTAFVIGLKGAVEYYHSASVTKELSGAMNLIDKKEVDPVALFKEKLSITDVSKARGSLESQGMPDELVRFIQRIEVSAEGRKQV